MGRAKHFFWYRIVATPLALGYLNFKFHHKVVGRDILKKHRNTGYFMYGNHTQDIGDALIPNVLDIPKETYVIVHPNNVSMPVLGKVTPYLGALPLPDDMKAYRSFLRAIEQRIGEGAKVVIYPEAHIWPFYTGIRPFPDDSFVYPIKHGVPAFCFTNTYQKRRFSKKPRIVTYIDGPFYPDESIPQRERKSELRGRVYECMKKRAELSQVEWIRYIKRQEKND
jgi:1-acyl-sn-glycerol-3-phosphate acyltransferase